MAGEEVSGERGGYFMKWAILTASGRLLAKNRSVGVVSAELAETRPQATTYRYKT